MRKQTVCFEFQEHEDYVASFLGVPERNTLVSAG